MNNEIGNGAILMKKASALSGYNLDLGPAQPAAGRQGDRQARAAGVAEYAASRLERRRQRCMPVAGAAGRTAFMEYSG